MSVEAIYVFFDRVVVDPFWSMTYGEFAKKYPKTKKRIAVIFASEIRLPSWEKPEGLDWVLVDELYLEEDYERYRDQITKLEALLEDKKLSWAVSHCNDLYYVMAGLFKNIPSIRKHGCVVIDGYDPWRPVETAGVEAFLGRKINWPVLQAILTLHYADAPIQSLKLTRKEHSLLDSKIRKMPPERVYPKLYRWQHTEDCWGPVAYTRCLDVKDTRLFMRFVIQAWKENWPVSRIEGYPEHRFRDFIVTKDLYKLISRKAQHFKKPCVFLYFS